MNTRFRTAAIATLFLLPAALAAQSKRPRAGLLTGFSSSSVSDVRESLAGQGSGLLSTSRRTGFDIGAFVQVPITSWFSIQPETHFVQRGVSISGAIGSPTSPTITLDAKLNYVQIPVLFRVDLLPPKSMVRPMFYAGPTYSVRVSCNINYSAPSAGINKEEPCNKDVFGAPMTDPFKDSDFGVIVGGGASFSLGMVSLTAQLRYSQGMKNIITDENNSSNTAKPKNNAISVLFGVGF